MSYSEPFVGCVAMLLAFAAATISVGPWTAPYQLRSIAAVRRRFGMPAARLVWIAVAVTSLISGIAILSGVRPSYATPAERSHLER